jgi:transcriptional regulator of acetoin/glycerol metabolism
LIRLSLAAVDGLISEEMVERELRDERLSDPELDARVRDALTRTGWNVRHSAQLVGVSRATMYRWMRSFGLLRPGKVSQVSQDMSRDT